MRRIQKIIHSLGWTICAIMMTIAVIVNSSWGQEQEVVAGGGYLFQKFCSPCHGQRATGDGPKAKNLVPKPANLTTLQERNGGTFPFWRAYGMIDGRKHLSSHGPRDMPVFGIWFRIPDDEVSIETEWADQVRGRIWQLLSFLESIQIP